MTMKKRKKPDSVLLQQILDILNVHTKRLNDVQYLTNRITYSVCACGIKIIDTMTTTTPEGETSGYAILGQYYDGD